MTPYGCKDRVIQRGYFVKVRCYQPDGTYQLNDKFIKHTMSTDCRYDKSTEDARCGECKNKGINDVSV